MLAIKISVVLDTYLTRLGEKRGEIGYLRKKCRELCANSPAFHQIAHAAAQSRRLSMLDSRYSMVDASQRTGLSREQEVGIRQAGDQEENNEGCVLRVASYGFRGRAGAGAEDRSGFWFEGSCCQECDGKSAGARRGREVAGIISFELEERVEGRLRIKRQDDK